MDACVKGLGPGLLVQSALRRYGHKKRGPNKHPAPFNPISYEKPNNRNQLLYQLITD